MVQSMTGGWPHVLSSNPGLHTTLCCLTRDPLCINTYTQTHCPSIPAWLRSCIVMKTVLFYLVQYCNIWASVYMWVWINLAPGLYMQVAYLESHCYWSAEEIMLQQAILCIYSVVCIVGPLTTSCSFYYSCINHFKQVMQNAFDVMIRPWNQYRTLTGSTED